MPLLSLILLRQALLFPEGIFALNGGLALQLLVTFDPTLVDKVVILLNIIMEVGMACSHSSTPFLSISLSLRITLTCRECS